MNAEFKLTKADVVDYARKYQYAQLMFGDSAEDYISSRCLILNRFISVGFPLFSQSIEKLLKAIIFLESGNPTLLRGPQKHNCYELKRELTAIRDYNLDKYDNLLQRLHNHWQLRYFDNKNQSNSISSSEINEFDELWMDLFEKYPSPIEVIYRNSFPSILFDERLKSLQSHYISWAIDQNKALLPKLEGMNQTYIAVRKHLYPNSQNKSRTDEVL